MGIRDILVSIMESAAGPECPAMNCDRCACLTESPPDALLWTGNVTIRVFICGPCRVLQVTDTRSFFDEGWGELRKRVGGADPQT